MIIYKTTNTVNGKIYVGKDVANNPNYIGSGIILLKAIKKYGKHKFVKIILEICQNTEHLNKQEQYWIIRLNSTDKSIGYNITDGGAGGNTWQLCTEEQRRQHLQKFINAGIQHTQSPEGRSLRSKLAKQLWQDPKHRKNVIDKLTGRQITWANKISKSVKENHKEHPRKPLTQEQKNKISQALSGGTIKNILPEIETKICGMYKINGPKTISTILLKQNINISPFIIIRILKKYQIYKKYQKGIG